MADRKKHRGVMSERAKAAAERIAERMKGRDASRLAALLSSADDQRRVDVDAMVESILTRLRAAIDNAEISRYAIEKRTGVTQSYLSKLMKGQRGNLTIETLAKLAVELGLTVRLEPARKTAREETAVPLKRKKRQ
jgi:predicted XRE-type DNA-binding protein